MSTEYMDINSLLLNPFNKELDKDKVASIKQAIEQSGTVKPLIYAEIDNEGKPGRLLTDGHHRYEALKQLGYKSIPVQLATEAGLASDKKENEPVVIEKEVSSVDVQGLDLTRQNLAGKARKPKKELEKGGPGSGCNPAAGTCGRPSTGNKAFDEPLHSGGHVQQFLSSENVVIASVDKSNLSPEKNVLRQKQFEATLSKWNLPYKKGQGVSSDWGNEASYIISAPRTEDSESLHHLLTKTYKQDAVIHIRNGHAVMNFSGGTNEPTRHANINGGLEAGDHLTDNYTNVDGQKFRINFK